MVYKRTNPILAIMLAVILIAGTVCFSLPVSAGEGNQGQPNHGQAAMSRLMVRFAPGTNASEMARLHRQNGATPRATIHQIGVQVVEIPTARHEAVLRGYQKNRAVRSVETDHLAAATDTPNDPYFSRQWGMTKVKGSEAWDTTRGNSGIRIAILDTGVDIDHPDLASKVVASMNFTSSPTADANGHSHGTHVAGIAAAITDNGVGVAGLGRDSSLMNVKVLGDDGFGYYSWISQGIIWAADNGADVINLSLGGSYPSSSLSAAIDYAWNKGAVVVAAAGNQGNSLPFYPAWYTNCIAVAGTSSSDSLYSWSNHGSWVDVAAPGTSYSTMPNNRYGNKSGTSMASPHVAGLAGLVYTTTMDSNGNGQINDEVRTRIEVSCDDVGVDVAYGRINASEAVQGATASLDINPSGNTWHGFPGETVLYTYTITNTGGVADSYDLSTSASWDSSVDTESLALGPGASSTVRVYHDVPPGAEPGSEDGGVLNVVSVSSSATGSAGFTTTALGYDVAIAPAIQSATGSPGDTVTYDFTVTNTGTEPDSYDLATSSGWASSVTPSSIALAAGNTTVVTLTHTVSTNVANGDNDTGTVTISSASAQDSANFTTEASVTTSVSISPSDLSLTGIPGDTLSYTYTVANTGDVTDSYFLSTDSQWASSVTPDSLSLDAGASAQVTVEHSIPINAPAGSSDTGTLSASSVAIGASDESSFTTTARVYAVMIQPDTQTGSGVPGNTLTYTYTVTNTGTDVDSYGVSSLSTWDSSVTPDTLVLNAGQTATITVSHTVHTAAGDRESDTGTLAVASSYAEDSVGFTTTATVAAVNIMHVGDISMATKTKARRDLIRAQASSTVQVVDQSGLALENAAVSGGWSGLYRSSVSGTTDSYGYVTFRTKSVWVWGSGTFTFTIDEVAKPGWGYDPASNTETSDSIEVP